jgi:hypothetical protein
MQHLMHRDWHHWTSCRDAFHVAQEQIISGFCGFCGSAASVVRPASPSFVARGAQAFLLRCKSPPASPELWSWDDRKTDFIQPSSSHSVPWYQHHLDHPAISIWRNDAKRFSLNEQHSVLAGRLLGNDKLLQVNIVRQGHFSPVTWWHWAKQSGCETTKGTILWTGKHWKSTAYITLLIKYSYIMKYIYIWYIYICKGETQSATYGSGRCAASSFRPEAETQSYDQCGLSFCDATHSTVPLYKCIYI